MRMQQSLYSDLQFGMELVELDSNGKTKHKETVDTLTEHDDDLRNIDAHGYKNTLRELHPMTTTIFVLVLCFGNIALLMFSHLGDSIYIQSNLKTSTTATTTAGDAGITLESCSQDSIYQSYWNTTGKCAYGQQAPACGVALFTWSVTLNEQAQQTAVECMEQNGYVGSVTCLTCYKDLAGCVLQQQCWGVPTVNATCVGLKCIPAFVICTGIGDYDWNNTCNNTNDTSSTTNNATNTTNTTNATDAATSSIRPVYTISFANSIKQAWEGKAYGIALVVLIFSGVWPYTKNLIVLFAWFVPCSVANRHKLLMFLSWFAKWSMVDLIVVIIILSGLYIDIYVPKQLLVYCEPGVAIVTYGIAVCWGVLLGEWVLHQHRHSTKSLSTHPVGEHAKEVWVNQLKLPPPARCLHGLFTLASMVCVCTAVAVPCVGFDYTSSIKYLLKGCTRPATCHGMC